MLRYYVSYVYGGGQGTFGSIIVERDVPISSEEHIWALMGEIMSSRPNEYFGRPLVLGFSKMENTP